MRTTRDVALVVGEIEASYGSEHEETATNNEEPTRDSNRLPAHYE
jgi:hypothetical protein